LADEYFGELCRRATMPPFQDPEIYREILDGLQIGVSVLDLERKIVFWSDGAEHISGYARIDVLGHPCTQSIFLHCNQQSCKMCVEKCLLESALHEGRPVEAISFIHHKSGHRTPVRMWAAPLRARMGSFIGIIVTFDNQFALAEPDPNERSMQERGLVDKITGLPNQAIMRSHLQETLGSFSELGIPFGVILLEPRGLNEFLAKYGKEAERSILRVLAQNLRNTVWPTDYVGAWNQSQLLVILSGCAEDALRAASRRIHKMTATATIQWWGEELSVAVDLHSAEARLGDTIETLLQRANAGENQELLPGHAAAGGASA
jgi:PAS domain S-box-containing protein/diguanylate cyclase (GGDEF)-like protein